MVFGKHKKFFYFFVFALVLLLGYLFFTQVFKGGDSTGGAIRTVKAPLTQEISGAKKQIYASNGHDFSKLYELLETNKGKKTELFRICDEIKEPIFCFKRISSQNPQFRQETCELLAVKTREKYEGKVLSAKLESYIKAHKNECLAGIDQYLID